MVPLSSATSKLASSNFKSRMSISSHSIPGLDSWCFFFICSIKVDEYWKTDSSQPVGLSSETGGRERERTNVDVDDVPPALVVHLESTTVFKSQLEYRLKNDRSGDVLLRICDCCRTQA